jgi:DNA ligase 1
MLFSTVVETSRRVGETSRRLEKIDLLAGLLRQLEPGETGTVVVYLSGYMRQGRTGVGWASLREAGAGAETPSLTVAEVDRTLDALAGEKGAGSEARRRALLRDLWARATVPEAAFLKGLLLGEIRQGALEGVMVEALAKASGAAAERVRRAVMLAGDIARVAQSLLESGEAGLAPYGLELFRPIQPMLAETAEDVGEALAGLGEAALEYKFDGQRVQVHRAGGEVRIFSRALNDLTAAVPEIVGAVRALPGGDLILDGEVLCLAPDGRALPFQVTARRFGRKLDLDRMRADLPLSPFWFDLLYLDGQPLLDEAQARRFAALAELAPPGALVPHLRTGDADQAGAFLAHALAAGNEGIMAKDSGAAYAAGARGQSWLKIKQAHTLDLVILAAEWGSGRRRGWLSNLHLGARDPATSGFAMLGKTFKGLTDEMLAWQTERFLALEVARDAYTVYVRPEVVAEVAFSDVQISHRYPSGMALRFARVKRYRPDKTAAEADTVDTVRLLARGVG